MSRDYDADAMSSGEAFACELHRFRGRCAIARCNLNQGVAVVVEDSWSSVLLEKECSRRCDNSLLTAEKLLRCPVTGLSFRSRDDQRAAWGKYYECEHRAFAASCPSSSVGIRSSIRSLPVLSRLALRTLWRGAIQGESPWSELEHHWEDLDAEREAQLVAESAPCIREFRRGLRQESTPACRNDEGLVGTAAFGMAVTEETENSSEVDVVARVLAALQVNAMVITDEEQRSLGLGLFLLGSIFNHSEEPNCVQSFMGPRLHIRTLRPVVAGEELTLPYGELGVTSSVRRAHLRAQYFFDPLPKGQLPESTAMRDRVLSEVQELVSTGGWQPCSQQIVWSVYSRFPQGGVQGKEASGLADAVSLLVRQVDAEWAAAKRAAGSGDALAAARRLRKAWDACSQGCLRLGEGHALRLAVARDGMDAALDAGKWGHAVVFARAVCCANRLIYPEGWPVIGLGLVKLAKLELYHRRFLAAAVAGEEAIRVLTVACNERTAPLIEARQIVAQARAEAGQVAVARGSGSTGTVCAAACSSAASAASGATSSAISSDAQCRVPPLGTSPGKLGDICGGTLKSGGEDLHVTFYAGGTTAGKGVRPTGSEAPLLVDLQSLD